jgi:hypothetical protein
MIRGRLPIYHAIAFLGLLAIVTANAAPLPTLDITTASLQTNGETQVLGQLVAFSLNDIEDGLVNAAPQYHLTAEHLRLETDDADAAVSASPAVRLLALYPQTHPSDHDLPNLQSAQARDSYRLTVLPIAGAPAPMFHASGHCSRLAPSDAQTLERSPLVRYSRGPLQADTASAMSWTSCDQGTSIIVQGDFLLVLWELDARLESSEGTRDLESGRRPSDQVPSDVPYTGHFGRASEQYLFIRNGTLSLDLFGQNPRTYLEQSRVDVQGTIRLFDTRGLFSWGNTRINLEGNQVALQGHPVLQVNGTEWKTPIAVHGGTGVTSIMVDGILVPTVETGGASWPFWLLPGVGAVLAGSVAMGYRQRLRSRSHRAKRFVDRSYHYQHNGDYAVALQFAQKALRLDSRNPDGWHYSAMSKGNLSDLEGALRDHKECHWRLESQPDPERDGVLVAENAYQAARVCAQLHLQAQTPEKRSAWLHATLHWLQISISEDPEYLDLARREPDFGPIYPDLALLASQRGGDRSDLLRP